LASTLADFARNSSLELDAAALSGAACFVARREERLIGLLALARRNDTDADVLWLGVVAAQRRQGVARDLLRVGAAWWARQGGRGIHAHRGCDAPILAGLGFAAAQDGAWVRRTG
jgi:GNAT superfamily N-acetyltransferase